jgi:hypothetical protein
MLILYLNQTATFGDSCIMAEILQFKEASLFFKSTELIFKTLYRGFRSSGMLLAVGWLFVLSHRQRSSSLNT